MEDRCAYKHKKGKYDGYSFYYRKGIGLEKMTGDPSRAVNIKEADINKKEWEITYALLEGMMGAYRFNKLKKQSKQRTLSSNK